LDERIDRLSSFLVLAALPVAAQQTGISGRVIHRSGAVIPTVSVNATAEDGFKISTVTNPTGLISSLLCARRAMCRGLKGVSWIYDGETILRTTAQSAKKSAAG
jgi:hypothetical protein